MLIFCPLLYIQHEDAMHLDYSNQTPPQCITSIRIRNIAKMKQQQYVVGYLLWQVGYSTMLCF